MTFHWKLPNATKSYIDKLYKKKIWKDKSIVERTFRIIKQCFQELIVKSNLHVIFLSNVIITCYLMHILFYERFEEVVD